MRPNESFYNEKPSQYRESYQNTAAKSPDRRNVNQTQEYTPTRFTKKPSDRVSQLKNSINRCIEELSNKKQLNRQALQQVKDVNREVVENLSGLPYGKQYRSNQRPSENYDQPQHRTDYRPRYDPHDDKERDNVTLSSFHLGGQVQNPARFTNFQTSEVYRPESSSSNQYETQQIRQKIQRERAQNEALQRQLQALQREQGQLMTPTANFGGQDSAFLMQENARLRNELERISTQQNINGIYEQFQRLKEDNEKLRKETINLLKNGRY